MFFISQSGLTVDGSRKQGISDYAYITSWFSMSQHVTVQIAASLLGDCNRSGCISIDDVPLHPYRPILICYVCYAEGLCSSRLAKVNVIDRTEIDSFDC